MMAATDLESALRRGARGHLFELAELLPALGSSTLPLERAHALLFRAHLHLLSADDGVAPESLPADVLADASCGATVARICSLSALAAVIAHDRSRLIAWHTVVCTVGPATADAARLIDGWRALLDGDAVHAMRIAAETQPTQNRRTEPEIVIEATILRGFATLHAEELEEATHLSRRAARMARAEGVLHLEYLANLVLARVRRKNRVPYRAARILTALEQVVAPAWRAWLAWEWLMIGELAAATRGLERARVSALSRVARSLADMLNAAHLGARDRFTGLWDSLSSNLPPRGPFGADAAMLRCALDPEAPPDREFDCLAGSAPASRAVLIVRPGTAPRRLLAGGLGLVNSAEELAGQISDRSARVCAALVVLVFAGQTGVERHVLFREVYGFEYHDARHSEALRTLLHRVRRSIAKVATVENHGASIVLVANRAFAVPEPITEQPLEERLLRVLAQMDGASARRLASLVGVPLRTVQLTLQSLLYDEVCIKTREHREVKYRVEDSSFSEPSLSRLCPKSSRPAA